MRSELCTLHRTSFHPSPRILLNHLKLDRRYESHSEITITLDDLYHKQNTCHRFSVTPFRFKVSLCNEEIIVSAHEIFIYRSFLQNFSFTLPDTVTNYSAATFLDKHVETHGQSVEDIWQALKFCWYLTYTGYPNCLEVIKGQLSYLRNKKSLMKSRAAVLLLFGSDALRSLGICGNLHDTLRRMSRKIRQNYTSSNSTTD